MVRTIGSLLTDVEMRFKERGGDAEVSSIWASLRASWDRGASFGVFLSEGKTVLLASDP